ncbi:diacylglycerol kinase family lipid kinase [Ktedonosporobacter rubrisoli]|uniref:Diacylglycerol kinase family lipid kinase n=1 Tax=Ktedonosporobacter rubrisoli TaxID=2509675 RepID=A0A4P6JUZ7_KTERU|nr:diacylglycerol kinase family protein [Ktedonosporobacter rubrisoli]QBD79324.1 diacylglycerol kinase family lipid kinase [Ktedonosporobacter rubrisoli]
MQENTRQETTAMMRVQSSATLIANPAAGGPLQHMHQIAETLTFLRDNGWQVNLKMTHQPGDARRFAHEAVEQKQDVVIVAGGDGTINEVIQELAQSQTALGVLPGGTVNVWAREVGIPLDYAGAREVLLHGQMRQIDLGQVNDEHYFFLMAGIGLDGEVTYAVEKKPVKRLGVIGYLLIGAWLGLGYRGFRAVLQVDGRVIKTNALQIIIGNTQLYGGTIRYTWQASCDDGLLDICIVRRQDMLKRILVSLDFLLGREERRQWVRYLRGSNVKIRTRQPIAFQLDGDPIGYTARGFPSTAFSIVPQALKVIVPQIIPEDLFSKASAGSELSETQEA